MILRPYSGTECTFSQVKDAVEHVYNLSSALSTILTIGGFFLCGHRRILGIPTRLDLHDLATHNVIEHDASLCRRDASPGEKYASTAIDPELVDALLQVNDPGEGEGMRLKDFIQARLRRLAEVHTDKTPVLSSKHETIMTGEDALTILMLGDTGEAEGVVDRERLKAWIAGERLPDGWTGPVSGKEIGFWKMTGVKKKVAEGIKPGIERDIAAADSKKEK